MGSGAQELAEQVKAWIAACAAAAGSTTAIKPGHREPFHWPPHPVAYQYRVHPDSWIECTTISLDGESFGVEIASWRDLYFGRCPMLWHDAKGETKEQMLANLKAAAQPLLTRQKQIAETLGERGRHSGAIRDLDPLELLKLLFCPNRDVAIEAETVIETRAASGLFAPALISILRDETHPMRRSAQWCVLDMFEDLPSFCPTEELVSEATRAMRDIVWHAEDDFARTVFKAGVVLGGHVPPEIGGPLLIECLRSPSKIGRRSAIHGLFHVVEWGPQFQSEVVIALRECAALEPVPELQKFAESMANDIEAGEDEHKTEPTFADEL